MKRKSNKFLTYVKKWYVIATAIIATFGAFLYISNAMRGYVEGVAEDIVREKLAAYPPPDGIKEIKSKVDLTFDKVTDLDKKIDNIDAYLRGKGIR